MNGVTHRVGDFSKVTRTITMMKAMRMLMVLTRNQAKIWLYDKNDDDDMDGMVDSARVA